MVLSTLILGAVVLVAWPPAPSVPFPNPALKHLQAFFSTWTVTRVNPGRFLLPNLLMPAGTWRTELTDLNFENETGGSLDMDSNSHSNNSNSNSTTWLVHAYAPFDADAQRTNALIEKQLGPMLAKRQQDQQHQQSGAPHVVRIGKLDVTQNRRAAQELLDMDEDAGVGSILTVLHLNVDGDGSGNEEQYHGPRTRQALEDLLDRLHANGGELSIAATPTHLTLHGEIQSFLKEHPLAFVLGRAEEGVVTEEEAMFTATCEALGWYHCAIVHSKKALLRAAVASLWESVKGGHSGAVIAKLDQGRDALPYQPSDVTAASRGLEDWMVQHGFSLVTHLDIAGPHVQQFVFGPKQQQQEQQQQRQLVVAVVRPFEDSVEEVKSMLDMLQDAARRHPETRFGYVTSTGSRGWPAFVAEHFVSAEQEGRVEEVSTSSECRLFLLDCATYALYEEPAGVAKLDVLLDGVQGETLRPRLLSLKSVVQAEKRVLSEEEVEQQQLETTAAVAGGTARPIDEGTPTMAPEAVRQLAVEGLAALCIAAVAVTLLLMTTAAGKKKETVASAAAVGKEEIIVEKKEVHMEQEQGKQYSLPTVPAFGEEGNEKPQQTSRMMLISESLD